MGNGVTDAATRLANDEISGMGQSSPISPWQRIGGSLTAILGFPFVLLGLGALAATPILHLAAMGYLLDASGRVARSGRLADGFIGARQGLTWGVVAIFTWLFLLPLRILGNIRATSVVIDPSQETYLVWTAGLAALAMLVVAHLAMALAKGGAWWRFLIPELRPSEWRRLFFSRDAYAARRDQTWNALESLKLPELIGLGLMGTAQALLWMALPMCLLAMGPQIRPINLVGLALGSVCAVAAPIAQTRLAFTDDWRSMFDARSCWRDFTRAPWPFALSVVVALAAPVPVYLLKFVPLTDDVAWLTGAIVVTTLLPGRLLLGWACARANRPTARAATGIHLVAATTVLVAGGAAYVITVFLSRYAAWNGYISLFEQHALLVFWPGAWSLPLECE